MRNITLELNSLETTDYVARKMAEHMFQGSIMLFWGDMGSGKTVRAITTGDSHTCTLLDNASLKCWGKNDSGQLGQGDTSNRGDSSGEMSDNLPAISL